ncbi:glycosyltransferase family 1 protein [Dichomitus squalens]|uniref:UDP-N-acetylglucosamine transferase subunit ALG14 n=1 Tax=Dichomitus squalens TaxID=114155 RepID=A0A4Q9PR26_9APHY|nr:glycosyltransferase family 1 protein [Dichomitus squalens]TBU56829.1 glycosyltransferase family 1 protein [Dichomitus squalens]
MDTLGFLTLISVLIAALTLLRLYAVLPSTQTAKPSGLREDSDVCSLAVFLGSGGHTSEALRLLSALNFNRYGPRTYIISEGDTLSMHKAMDLECAKSTEASQTTPFTSGPDAPCSFVVIPRARRVHQSFLTAPFSAALSLAASIWHLTASPLFFGPPAPDVLLLNGPGTCFVLCIAAYLSRFLGLKSPKLIYVESFARVRHLSLSGKLLRPLVDRFIVQWPDLLQDGKRGECRGWLV